MFDNAANYFLVSIFLLLTFKNDIRNRMLDFDTQLRSL